MRLTPALLATAALVSACTALKLPQPASQNTFLLDAVPPASAQAAARHDLTLEVGRTRAWPGFDTSAMAYTRRANELEYFAKNRWADAPAHMIRNALQQEQQ